MKTGKKTIAERLEELLEAQRAERPWERVPNRLRWEEWDRLRPEAAAFAAQEIGRWKWRGARDGVLPGGVGPEDIADQVIEDLLSGRSGVTLGWTRERLVRRLRTLVGRRVRELHERSEAEAMRSEWEVIGAGKDGEAASIFEVMAGEDGSADDGEAERGVRLREAFDKLLDGELELQAVFRCVCEGVRKSGEIGQRLGLPEAEVRKARRRLRRKLARWLKERGFG